MESVFQRYKTPPVSAKIVRQADEGLMQSGTAPKSNLQITKGSGIIARTRQRRPMMSFDSKAPPDAHMSTEFKLELIETRRRADAQSPCPSPEAVDPSGP